MSLGWRIAAPVALFVCLTAFAQSRRVAAANQHERLIAIVPMVGSGASMEDPKRPMFAPLPGEMAPGSRTGIIAFHFIPSDNGQFAIVELIARDKAAFHDILSTTDPRVKVFLRGRDHAAALLLAIRAIRKDFDLQSFGQVVVP